MLNFLPSSISFYIILTLSILLAVVSTISVKLYRGKVEAESALVVAIDANTDLQKSLNLKDLSCKIDDQSVVELVAENGEVRDKIDHLVEKITNLKTGIKEAPNNVESITIHGPELLSPDLRSLLDEAYCLAEPTASVCWTTGQPTNLPVQSSPIR